MAVNEYKDNLNITLLCNVLKIQKSSIYYKSKLDQKDQLIADQIAEIHKDSIKAYYWHRRIAIEVNISNKKSRRIMNKLWITPILPKKKRWAKPWDRWFKETWVKNLIKEIRKNENILNKIILDLNYKIHHILDKKWILINDTVCSYNKIMNPENNLNYAEKQKIFNKQIKIRNDICITKNNSDLNKPGKVYVTDFSHIFYRWHEFYLSTVIDVYTKEVIAYDLWKNHDQEFIIWTINKAIKQWFELWWYKPYILHSDQWSEYRSQLYTDTLKKHWIEISMSKKASPRENWLQEWFYWKLKFEIWNLNILNSLEKAYERLYIFLFEYNSKRIQSSLKMSPIEFRKKEQNRIKNSFIENNDFRKDVLYNNFNIMQVEI